MSQNIQINLSIFIADESARKNVNEHLEGNKDEWLIDDNRFTFEMFLPGQVTTISATGNDVLDINELLLTWLKNTDIDIALVEIVKDRGLNSFGLFNDEKVTYKKALLELMEVSQIVKAAMTIDSYSEEHVMAYIKENQINPMDSFQNLTHLDRLFYQSYYAPIKHFVTKGLVDINCFISHPQMSWERPLPFKILDFVEKAYPLIKVLHKNGLDINFVDEDDENLLHAVSLHIRKKPVIKFVQYLLENNINVNQLSKHGIAPLLDLVMYFSDKFNMENDFSKKVIEKIEDNVIEICKLYVGAGADLGVYDLHGRGLLFFTRNRPRLSEYFLSICRDLSPCAEGVSFEKTLIATFGSPEQVEYYEKFYTEKIEFPYGSEQLLTFMKRYPFRIIELACQYDDIKLIDFFVENLCKPLGIPLLKNMRTLDLAKKYKAHSIIEKFEEAGFTKEKIKEYYVELKVWQNNVRKVSELNEKKNFMTEQFLKSVQEQWDAKKASSAFRQYNSYEDYLARQFQIAVFQAPKNVKGNIWGHKGYIVSSAQLPGTAYLRVANGYMVGTVLELTESTGYLGYGW